MASNEIEGPRPLLPRDGLNLIWVQDEALLHREDTDELLQLDHLGAELWEMIGCGMSLENLIDVLGGSDEVVRCPIAAKVRAFVEELLHLGLIRLG